MSARNVIGYDRELRQEWLDAVAARVAAGDPPEQVRVWLDGYLSDVLGGKGRGGNRGKTVTVLGRIWSNVPASCRDLRDRAIATLGSVSAQERIAVHWGMATAVYPFFGDVTNAVGRLLALQGDVERHAVLKRLAGSWGDRPAVSRACRAIWSSLIHWRVMEETDRRGRYRPLEQRVPVSAETTSLLVEAVLHSAGRRSISVTALSGWPGLFPFQLRDLSESVAGSTSVIVRREGTDSELARRVVAQA